MGTLSTGSGDDAPHTRYTSLSEGVLDAIVVGSGFGGAVAGARLAQAGLKVAILERGRRWPRGSFPRDDTDLKADWLWHRDGGLFDIRWLDRMLSVQGAGWGGGSLVYANVFARPSDETFRPYWPDTYSRATLDRYFDLAAHMLEVGPIQADPTTGDVPVRTRAMEDLVRRMDRAAGTVRPNLAVRFTADPNSPVANRHGVLQHGCTFVGECVIGCNQGAKNSLDYNYLAVAERAGALALTRAEVLRVEPFDNGYRVTYRDLAAGGEHHVLTGRSVFLAAGAVATTELLLRARDVEKTLPDLSPRLGEGFSGNGDFLSLIRQTRIPLDPERGPTITTTSVVDFDEAGNQVWFQVQDGAYPAVLSRLGASLNPTRHIRQRVVRTPPASTYLATQPNETRRSRHRSIMALLLMGRDASQGRLVLDHHNQASVQWDNRANRRLYRAEGQVGRAVARMLGGRSSDAPTWSLLRRAVTVHGLGGVPMGIDREQGVIDEYGEVHGYQGLYVVDGAAVPSATGVNPSASILAMAERNVERAIRRILGDELWEGKVLRMWSRRPRPGDDAWSPRDSSHVGLGLVAWSAGPNRREQEIGRLFAVGGPRRAGPEGHAETARAMSDGFLAVVRPSTVLPSSTTVPSSSRIPMGYLPRSRSLSSTSKSIVPKGTSGPGTPSTPVGVEKRPESRWACKHRVQHRADTVHTSLGFHGAHARPRRNEALSRVALHRVRLRYPYAGCSESP